MVFVIRRFASPETLQKCQKRIALKAYMRLKKKIFEIGAEMTEKIEIKLLAPLYTWAVTIQCVPKKVGINENF